MEDILELASKLGKRIAGDQRARALVSARRGLDEDLEARQTLADYEETQQKLADLETGGKPLEPEDKRKLADLHAKVIGNDIIKALLKAQADFLQLMTQVSQTIDIEALSGEDKQ